MTETDKWENDYGVSFLEQVGIKRGDIVFDCCCGEGNYTLPAARIVGKDGLVYALERNKDKIKMLKEKSSFKNLSNIKIIEKEFDEVLPLPDKSIDILLLYDIFWYFSIENSRLPVLLHEAYRILKDSGLVSIYPEHIDRERLKKIIINNRFYLEQEISGLLVHDNHLIKGYIWNFKKLLNN